MIEFKLNKLSLVQWKMCFVLISENLRKKCTFSALSAMGAIVA